MAALPLTNTSLSANVGSRLHNIGRHDNNVLVVQCIMCARRKVRVDSEDQKGGLDLLG